MKISYKIFNIPKLTQNQIDKIAQIIPDPAGSNIYASMNQEDDCNYKQSYICVAYNSKKACVGAASLINWYRYSRRSRYATGYLEDLPYELNILVAKKYRRKGIGKKLTHLVLTKAKSNKIRVYHTPVGEKFYNRLSGPNEEEFILKTSVLPTYQKFINPKTFRWISVKSGLKYDKKHIVYKIAKHVMGTY